MKRLPRSGYRVMGFWDGVRSLASFGTSSFDFVQIAPKRKPKNHIDTAWREVGRLLAAEMLREIPTDVLSPEDRAGLESYLKQTERPDGAE